jgi:hypothetical protein
MRYFEKESESRKKQLEGKAHEARVAANKKGRKSRWEAKNSNPANTPAPKAEKGFTMKGDGTQTVHTPGSEIRKGQREGKVFGQNFNAQSNTSTSLVRSGERGVATTGGGTTVAATGGSKALVPTAGSNSGGGTSLVRSKGTAVDAFTAGSQASAPASELSRKTPLTNAKWNAAEAASFTEVGSSQANAGASAANSSASAPAKKGLFERAKGKLSAIKQNVAEKFEYGKARLALATNPVALPEPKAPRNKKVVPPVTPAAPATTMEAPQKMLPTSQSAPQKLLPASAPSTPNFTITPGQGTQTPAPNASTLRTANRQAATPLLNAATPAAGAAASSAESAAGKAGFFSKETYNSVKNKATDLLSSGKTWAKANPKMAIGAGVAASTAVAGAGALAYNALRPKTFAEKAMKFVKKNPLAAGAAAIGIGGAAAMGMSKQSSIEDIMDSPKGTMLVNKVKQLL